MRTLRFTGRELVQDDSRPVPDIATNEALVRVSLAGICSTDLEIAKGYFGFEGVLGHEFVGTVEQTQHEEWLGKRVVSSINFADTGSPEIAQYGLEHHPHRKVLGILGHDGAMADYVSVPVENLYAVPNSVTDEEAVFTEPLAAALRIRQQIVADPSSRIAVLGPGRLGLLVAQVLATAGTPVSVVGRSARSLELPRQLGLEARSVESVSNERFDIVVDATGSPAGLRQAIELTKPLGTLILKSTYAGAADVDLTKIVVDEIRLVGSRCGPFEPALRMLANKQVSVTPLIDAEYPIEEALQAFKHAAQPGVRKILLRIDSASATA